MMNGPPEGLQGFYLYLQTGNEKKQQVFLVRQNPMGHFLGVFVFLRDREPLIGSPFLLANKSLRKEKK
jgi:hypothetical protein